MKPSSLATVLVRLAALYIAASGAVMVCAAIALNFYLNSLITQNGPPSTLSGKVFDFQFQASSVGYISMVQIVAGLAVVFVGYLLFSFSRAIGKWVGRGLE